MGRNGAEYRPHDWSNELVLLAECVTRRENEKMGRLIFTIAVLVSELGHLSATNTWDDAYDTSQIEVTLVYFVPSDRMPLADWRQRVDYYSKRIEQFHAREFQGQSRLTTVVRPEPFVSGLSTNQL